MIFRSLQISPRAGQLDPETRTIRGAPLSVEVVDEHRSLIVIDGLTPRAKALPLHVDHDSRVDGNIGRVTNFRKGRVAGVAALLGDLHFATTGRGPEIFERIVAGDLSSFSIGFIPEEDRNPTQEEEARGAREVITRARLIEVSVVSLPSNAAATLDAALASFRSLSRPTRATDELSMLVACARAQTAVLAIGLLTAAKGEK